MDALYLPHTLPLTPAPLLLLADRLICYQAVDRYQDRRRPWWPPALFQFTTPVTGDHHADRRFAALLGDLGRHGEEFLAGALFARGRDAAATAVDDSVEALVTQISGRGNQTTTERRTWEARLLLALDEDRVLEEMETAHLLTRVEERRQRLLAELRDEEPEEAPARPPRPAVVDRGEACLVPWATLHLAAGTPAPFLATDSPAVAEAIRQAAARTGTEDRLLARLPIPTGLDLAGVDLWRQRLTAPRDTVAGILPAGEAAPAAALEEQWARIVAGGEGTLELRLLAGLSSLDLAAALTGRNTPPRGGHTLVLAATN